MKPTNEIEIIEKPIPGELYLGRKTTEKQLIYLMFERFRYEKEENTETARTIISRNMLTEERQSIDAKCTGIDNIITDGKDLYVAAEVSKHQLKDFLATQKLDKHLKGALAYNIAEIVQEIHEHNIHNNNITIERLSIYEDGTLCMLSNYTSRIDAIKQIQPSTQKTTPQELLIEKTQALDAYRTAMAIHEIFTRQKLDMTSHAYKRDKRIPRKIFEILGNVLDKERCAKYTKPNWLTGRTKQPDTNYILKELKAYSHHCEELNKKMREYCKSRN